MPTGKYYRSPEMMEQVKINLAKGRETKARKKATETIRVLVKTPEWREKVSQTTQAAMHLPHIREKHLAGLRRMRASGTNFKGGNGQTPVMIVQTIAKVLEPLGFIREFPIKTKNHQTGEKVPTCYKVDFGHPLTKRAIEVDGQSHRPKAKQLKDQKKDKVLTALGWTILRIKH